MLEHGDFLAVVGLAVDLFLSPVLVVDQLDAEKGVAEEIAHVSISGNAGIRSLHLNDLADIVKSRSAYEKLTVKQCVYSANGICRLDHSVCVVSKTAVDIVMHGLGC